MTETTVLTWRAQTQEQQQEGGAPAPAAAPAPAPAVPSAGDATGGAEGASRGAEAPAASPVYETLGEDEQIIFDMTREHEAKKIAETPAEQLKAKKKGKGEKQEPAPAAPPAAETPPPAPEPAAGALVKYGTPKEAIDAIVAAIDSGDPKKIAKALGKPEAYLDANNARWVAFREQQNAVRERDKQVTQREHDFNEKLAAARTEFGPAIKAAKAYRDGDLTAFVTLVQELTGESYDEAQRKVIKGELAIDPAVRKLREELAAERAERKREREEEKAAAEAAKQTATQQENYERAVKAVADELAGHRVSKVKGYQREVLNRVRESWDADEKSYTMSFAEAADAIMAERDEEAAALGYHRPAAALPAAPPAPAPPAPAPSVPPRARAADARPADVEPWADPDAEDMDDDAIIESIKRDVKAGRLKP